MLTLAAGYGTTEDLVMRDGYLLVELTLSRPEPDCGTPAIEVLRQMVPRDQ